MADDKKRLPKINAGTEPLAPFLRGPLRIGQVGRLEFPDPEIRQVVDESNLLADVIYRTRESTRGLKALYWVKGVGTRNLSDGNRVDLEDEIFIVEDSKQYGTALGSTNTVRVLRVMSNDEVEALRTRLVKK